MDGRKLALGAATALAVASLASRRRRGSPAKPLDASELLLTSITEHGRLFETGVPVKMPFYRNTESSRRHGIALQRGGLDLGLSLEPAGRYMLHRSPRYRQGIPNLVTGTVVFQSPIVIEHRSTGSTGWKGRLSKAFGGKSGLRLSRAIVKAGYDGIVTVDSYSRDPNQRYTSEIVDLTFLARAGSKARRSRGRRGSLSRVVDAPLTLYHGTSIENLAGILRAKALAPGAGYSPHRTKTGGAVFLTDELVNATMYGAAWGDGVPFAVFEIDTNGLTVLPDYDDSGEIIAIDLSELEQHLREKGIQWKPKIGAIIPSDDLAREIDSSIEEFDYGGDRVEPICLRVVWDDGVPYLYAEPYLCQHISDEAIGHYYLNDESLYDWLEDEMTNSMIDVSWDGGTSPCLLVRQYMVQGEIPLAKVRRVFVSADWLASETTVPADVKIATTVNPGRIVTPKDEDGYQMSVGKAIAQELDNEVDFDRPTVAVLTVPQLRSLFAGSGSRARRRPR